MSPAQEENLKIIREHFNLLVEVKYRKGDREHDGEGLMNLSITELLNNAIEEAVDQVVYLISLKRKLSEKL